MLIPGIKTPKSIVADIHIENMHEFRRGARYHHDITDRADKGILRLYEVLERYGNDNTVIELHISGDDGRDGRMHFTKTYTLNDIHDGEFTAGNDDELVKNCGIFMKSAHKIREICGKMSALRQ